MFTAKMIKGALLCCTLMAGVTSLATPSPARADEGGSVSAPARNGNGHWAVMADSSLKSTLEGWSRAAGWTLVWDSSFDYRLRASAAFAGGYEEAVGRLIDSIYQSNPEITVTLYRGNRVLHVQEQPLASN